MNRDHRFILYFGSSSSGSNSLRRAEALRRLGYEVTILDPAKLIGNRSRWISFLDYRTGYFFIQRNLLNALKSYLADLKTPDVIWVNGGEFFSSSIVKWFRLKYSCKIVLYQNDDPTGTRDGYRFKSLLNALPFYDLCVFVRPETTLEALSLGARQALRVFPSYDEISHTTSDSATQQSQEFMPNVSFVGTLIPKENRDKFLASLIHAGLPVVLIGSRWSRSPLWHVLRNVYQGPALSGREYALALRSAAISLGFLSHGNRDLVTRRSFETPACGGLLCAERTSEHQLLYEDGCEAVFWSSEEECISQCRTLLADTSSRDRICKNGTSHLRSIGAGNEDICRHVMSVLSS